MQKENVKDKIPRITAEYGDEFTSYLTELFKDIAHRAVEESSKIALDFYVKEKEKEKKKEKEKRADRRLRDSKRLMRNYREIKIHVGDAIATLAEVNNENFDFFKDLMEGRSEVGVDVIVVSKAKSAILLANIEAALKTYQAICFTSKKPEDQRRYRVLESLYLLDNQLTAQEIAERENIDTRTVYKDFDAACEKMSGLLFGTQWIEHD